MTLLEHVDHLRALAQLDGDTTLLQMAMLNVLEELAATVDRLEAAHQPPDDRGHFGTI
jgi:hypothetical protein